MHLLYLDGSEENGLQICRDGLARVSLHVYPSNPPPDNGTTPSEFHVWYNNGNARIRRPYGAGRR